MNDSTSPRGGLALAQGRRAFPAERCCQLTAKGCIFVSQIGLTEIISQPGDVVEAHLHVFGYLLRRTAFGHTTSSWDERWYTLLVPISSCGSSSACSWSSWAVTWRGTAALSRFVRQPEECAVRHPLLLHR